MGKKNELAKNTLILMVGKVCTQFVSFFLLPMYTAILAPEEYGMVDLFNTYCALLLPIFNWQFDNGLFRFLLDVRDDTEGQKNIFTTVLRVNGIQVIIYLVFYFVAQNFISSPYKIYLAIDVVLNIYVNSLLQFSRGIGRTATYTIASFISATSMVCINVILIAILRIGVNGMFIATVAAKVITLIYLVISLNIQQYYLRSRFDKKLFKEISKYSFPLIPNHLSWWVVGVSDRIIISYILDVAANGIYSVANKFSGVFINFYNIFNLSWTESVSVHLDEEDSKEFLGETINEMFVLFACACFGLISIMPFLFPVMVNEHYSAAYQQIPILMIAVLFQIVVGLYSVFYVALKKSKEIAKTSFYAATINIVINLLLIKKIELYAASVSTLAAYMIMGIYRYFHVKKYVDIPLNLKNVLSILIIGSISVGCYYSDNITIQVLGLSVICVFSVLANYKFFGFLLVRIRDKICRRQL